MGLPLDPDTSSFLTSQFLDKNGRYLIYSSHVQFPIGQLSDCHASAAAWSTSGRKLLTIQLPICTDRQELQVMTAGGSSVTNLEITLALGIPSLLFLMKNSFREEKTFQERFDEVIQQRVGGKRFSVAEKAYVARHEAELIHDFLLSLIDGDLRSIFFESFSNPAADADKKVRYPLPYIPLILQFLGEKDCVSLFETLKVRAETVEDGEAWEMVVILSLYIRCLAAKHCNVPLPFDDFGAVDDVQVLTAPDNIQTVQGVVDFIEQNTRSPRTVYIIQLAFSKFPDFDGFVCYRQTVKRTAEGEDLAPPISLGIQCKLTRGYPRHELPPAIKKAWFLRGGPTIRPPDNCGWTYPSMDWIQDSLLCFGLRILHPMEWSSTPPADNFD